jgi:hypothetical protein
MSGIGKRIWNGWEIKDGLRGECSRPIMIKNSYTVGKRSGLDEPKIMVDLDSEITIYLEQEVDGVTQTIKVMHWFVPVLCAAMLWQTRRRLCYEEGEKKDEPLIDSTSAALEIDRQGEGKIAALIALNKKLIKQCEGETCNCGDCEVCTALEIKQWLSESGGQVDER